MQYSDVCMLQKTCHNFSLYFKIVFIIWSNCGKAAHLEYYHVRGVIQNKLQGAFNSVTYANIKKL
jgi:hypothetical protein